MTCDPETLSTILWYTRITMWGMSVIVGYAIGSLLAKFSFSRKN